MFYLKKMSKIIKYLTDSDFRFSINHSRFDLYHNMPDDEFLKRMFRLKMGYELDLNNPQTFNGKLQWLKLYDRKPIYTTMVDKYEVKKFVANIIGNQYVIPTLGIWNFFNEIDFTTMPNQFVLKCTHDSGGNFICRDKCNLNLKDAKKKIEDSLKHNFYYIGREWPYKNVIPRIIAEQYLEDYNSCELSVYKGLTDYKFFCFDGKPEFLYVSRGLENHPTAEISFYDMEGQELPFHRSDYKPFHNATMPKNFNEMKLLAARLANNIPCQFVRIDLYSICGKTYFSEITFSPCSGFLPFEPAVADIQLGKMLKLPIKSL